MSARAWLWLGLGLALWAGGAAVTFIPPRGIRNNNPMNVRRTGDRWLGMRAVQTDPAYVEFERPEYGLRAGGIVLLNYQRRYGLNTLAPVVVNGQRREGIISRYAPEHENPTDAYIANLAARLKVRPDEPIDVAARLPELMRGIVIQENGAAAAALHVPQSLYDAAMLLIAQRNA